MKKALLVLFLSSIVVSWAKPAKNLVLILADDLGWADTTLYGKTSLYETPNIERLAKRGMRFSNAYSSPICSPTRASILTGQNPARHGMTSPAAHLPEVRLEVTAQTRGAPHQKSCNLKTATRIRPEVPTLGEILKDSGYQTAHFGKWHLGREGYTPLEHGFDIDLPHWHGPGPKTSYLAPWGYENPDFAEGAPGEHIEDRMAKEATAWLKKRDSNKPFFLNYWQFSVHAPFGAKPELIDYYRKKIKRGEKQQSPTYAAMVHSLDDAVGSLLDTLDAEGLTDDTVVIFYSDNGGNIHCGLEETDAKGEKYVTAITSNYPLRGGKGGIREGGIRVPAVIVWPGVTKPGSINETRIQANDLYPTVLKMLNLSYPQGHVIDGVDFTKALTGKTLERKPMFTFVPGHGNTPEWLPPSMAVHHGKWKFIRTFHYGENGQHQYWLHDLEKDIGEKTNLASKFPDRVKKMDKWVDDYVAEAKVVVPLPNPEFDPAKFDPKLIGVQAGGLKMPPVKKAPGTKGPPQTVRKEFMLGWIGKGMEVSTAPHSIKISNSHHQPFLANASLEVEGPVLASVRLRSAKSGKGTLQWRTSDQKDFSAKGQSKKFSIKGGDWQEVEIKLPVKGTLQHLRMFVPAGKDPLEIDWIELKPADAKADTKQTKRWDFGTSKMKSQGAQSDLRLKVMEYAPGKSSIRLKTPTHIAFGPGNREIITDLKNNRFVFREGPEESFQVSPVPMRGPHSVVYNPKDKLYYANDTENHRMIAFADLSKPTIRAQTKKIAGVTLRRPHDVVLDPSTGWIYAINPGSGHVFRFTSIGENESAIKVPLQGYARALTFANGKLYAIGSAKGRIVEIVDWDAPSFKIYDSHDPTGRNGSSGFWTKTGLVLNDAEFFEGFWYATSYFMKQGGSETDFDENKFIRFKTFDDFVKGRWTDLSELVPSGITPYYLTVNKGKLYLAIFNHGAPGKGDSILQFTLRSK